MSTITEKIAKLLALADSPNEHEAASAAEKAQALMLEHGIDMAHVAASKGESRIGADHGFISVKTDGWRHTLAHHIARSMGGRVVRRKESERGPRACSFHFFGPAGTVKSMIQLYDYLETELTKLSAIETACRADKTVNGRTYRSSFLLGATNNIGQRLKERMREAEAKTENSAALVVIKSSVDEKMREEFPYTQKTARTRPTSGAAYQQGQIAASKVSLGESRIGRERASLTA